MGKGALKVLAVEYLSGLWICDDAKCLAVEDKCECVDAYDYLKGYAIARSSLWLFLFHGMIANSS